MVYEAWRKNLGPTQHPPNPTAVTADVLEIGFVFAFAVLAFCFALIVPGFRGIGRLYFAIRVIVSIFIGAAILLGVLGQEWESAEIDTRTPYKAFTNTEIHARVGIKIGLGSVNVTLRGTPVDTVVGHVGNLSFREHIDYNERFNWAWRQGRIGFGPYSGRINQELRAAQYRGSPLPILWIAEYFTLDGELIRWGRSYRTAGWFTNEVLWTAVPTWFIANILSIVVLFYAGWMFLATGGLMLVSAIIWASIKWGYQPLRIPFENGVLEPHYGSSFALVIAGGLVSCLWGIFIICADLWAPQFIADFFGNDVLKDYDQYYHKEDEDEAIDDIQPSRKSGAYTTGVRKRANRQTVLGRLVRPTQRRKSRPGSTISRTQKEPEQGNGIYYNDGFDGVDEIRDAGNVGPSNGGPSHETPSNYEPAGYVEPDYEMENVYENEGYEHKETSAV